MQQSALSNKKYLNAEKANLSVFQIRALKMNGQLYISTIRILSIGINIHCICFH